MIAATYTQGGAFEVIDLPRPSIANDEILLRVEAASICGTDLKIIRHGHQKLAPGQRIILGHEFAGTIEEVGNSVEGFEIGQRIGVAPNWGCGKCCACRRQMANYCLNFHAFGINVDGAHAEWIRIPGNVIIQHNLEPLPDSVSWNEISLAEPLSCVIAGLKAADLEAGDSILIYGMGPMGLLHVMASAAAGARTIIGVDPKVDRLERAKRLGATHTILAGKESVPEAVMQWSEGLGVDAVVTATPVPEIVSEALNLLGTFGRLCLFAGLPANSRHVPLDANRIHYRSLSIVGTTGGANHDYREAVRLIASNRIDVKQIVSHYFPLNQLVKAYESALSGGATKVVLTRAG